MHRSLPTCIDASLVVRFVAIDDQAVLGLWRRWRDEGALLSAPTLLRYEVTNALHRMRRAGQLSNDATQNGLRAAMALPIRIHGDEGLHDAALDFADRFRLSAAYDAHYLALADRLGAEFWTADQRLFNSVRHALPWVQLVGP